MTKPTKTPNISPAPGYILVEPYVVEKVFKSDQEMGEDEISTVLAVGDSVIDQQGNVRNVSCKPKDVIIHAQTNKTFTLNFTPYKFVHFSELHATYAATR